MEPSVLANNAPSPAQGSYADGYAPVAETFAAQLRSGAEIGAGFTVYRGGSCVVDLWGGEADVASRRPWTRDTRAVVFSVTKGLVAMALNMLGDRGKLDWDAPVASVWPRFAEGRKEAVTMRTLFNHRAGLLGLDEPFSLDDCVLPERYPALLRSLERQRPLWEPGRGQGYHAATFGMYAREVFERIAGESIGTFLRRELFVPLSADASLGTPASEDARIATLYPPGHAVRLANMVGAFVKDPDSNEARVARALASGDSLVRRAFFNPSHGRDGLRAFDAVAVRRAELAWVGATASAHGVARAYLPFALGGEVDGRRYLGAQSLAPLHRRQGWSDRDSVLQKPLGWSQGFLKDETRLFSPHAESFGHAGIGGALGWCDPVSRLTIGYVMNKLDWRVRSPRAVALCHALYACEPVRAAALPSPRARAVGQPAANEATLSGMKLVESVTRFTLLATIVPVVFVVVPGCTKKDEAPPPLPSATAEPVAPPTPAPSAALPIAPMPPAPGQSPNTLAEAIAAAKPQMKDSSGGPDEGATTLLNYWLQKNYAWAQLEAIPASAGATFLSATDGERGKRICGAGVIQTFNKVSDNPKQHEATIATPEGVLSVGAVGDVTGMKQGGQGRFCGIASGVQTMAGAGGAQVRAIRTTGYFDTPANRGGGAGGGIGNLRACCQALQQNSTSMPPPNNMYAAAAASYCNASVASISNPAQKDAVLAGIRGALRGVPMPAVCK